MPVNSTDMAQCLLASGVARKSLSDDLRAARLHVAVIRRRQQRGDYACQDVNFVSLIELQSEAHNLAYDFRTEKK